MKRRKQIFLKVWPYASCVFAGLMFFLASIQLTADYKGLFLNIAAAFLAIPFLYLIYELAQKFSQRRLNKELFDYAKMQIDRELLSIVNQLTKVVYPYEKQDFSFQGIQNFLSQSSSQIGDVIEKGEYIGFQVLKNWSISERNLHGILESPFILHRLEDGQIISVISVLKELRSLESIQKNVTDLYVNTNKKVDNYKITSGKEISDRNIEYPDRYLLLRYLKGDKYQVADFGDFAPYRVGDLLNIFRFNNKYIKDYSDSIYDFIKAINEWLDLTGSEFLIDTKMFRLGMKTKRGQAYNNTNSS
jgi:hypothetical protein